MTDGSGGYLLALLTDSFLVRAFIGTLAAVILSLFAIRLAPIQSPLGRRMLVLAPVITAAAAALASVGGQFLPTLLIMSAPEGASGGNVVDMLGESHLMTQARNIGILLTAYMVAAVLLLSRRATGALRVRTLLRGAAVGDDATVRMVGGLSARLGLRSPEVRLVENCPGGAFSAGRVRPVIALDRGLVASLDSRELEGLLAHELAHLRRADPLTGLVVGVIRDLAFFLPAIHIAARWLSLEQEESADELAATLTQRPAALASGLLKVWQAQEGDGRRSMQLRGACAASGTIIDRSLSILRPSTARLVPAGLAPWPAPDGMTVITRRVQRLISSLPQITRRRSQIEMGVGVGVTILAVIAALAAPAWLSRRHADLLGFFYVTNEASSASSAESPAFTTFRVLASDARQLPAPGARAVVGGPELPLPSTAVHARTADPRSKSSPSSRQQTTACPCVATPSQLALRQSASPTTRVGSVWGSQAWTLQHLRNQADLQATRRLLLVDGTDQQFGFLTAGRNTPQPAAAHRSELLS